MLYRGRFASPTELTLRATAARKGQTDDIMHKPINIVRQ